MIEYGSSAKPEPIKVGDTFRIFANLSGDFAYEYKLGRPFKSTDPELRLKGGEEREATQVGKFPFRCFINGKELPNADGSPGLEGELEVLPGP